MSVAIRATFWVVTFGSLGYALFKLVKPDDELLKQFDEGSKLTDARRVSQQTINVLKEAAKPDSELNKVIEDLLKKGK